MQAYANLPRSRGRLKTAFYVSTTLWIQFNHTGPRVVVEDPSNEWLIHTASVVGDQCASRECFSSFREKGQARLRKWTLEPSGYVDAGQLLRVV